jgi:L-iditol 2-dehydrogenase
MRVLRLHSPTEFKMHDEPVPSPGPGEVLVRVSSVGICASDVHWWRDGRIGTTVLDKPIVLGHEAAGTIESVGDGVTSVKPGQRVAVEPARPCFECEFCAAGRWNVCPSVLFFGTPPTDGCFQDYIVWPEKLVLPIPDELTNDEAAMVEPLAVGLYVAELAAVQRGEKVAILGSGAIGLSTLQSIKLAGAGTVLVVDPVESRRALALKLGADAACSPEEAEARAKELTDGRGFDVVVECAGEPEAVRQSARLARDLGRAVIVGIPRGDDYPFDASAARRKQLAAQFVRRSNNTTEPAIELVREGKIDVASFATHIFPLEQVDEAMRMAETKSNGVLRAVIRVS